MKRLAVLLCLAATGCAQGPWLTFGYYSGYFEQGFEVSRFIPAGTHENWWVNGAVPCPAMGKPDPRGPAQLVHLVVKGTLSAEGEYGHMGAYTRALDVAEVISCRKLMPNERPEL